MAKNVGNVPKKQWRKWTQAQQATFNRVRMVMRDQSVIAPEAKIPRETWDVIRWNAAFMAAGMNDDMTIAR
jgi:hypothetical protein